MRSAEADAFLEKLSTARNAWPSRIVEIGFSDLGTLGTGTIPIEVPVSVLSGFCGAGKSTVLRAVWGALDPAGASSDKRLPLRLGAGHSKVVVERAGGKIEFAAEFVNGEATGPGYDFDVTFLESGGIVESTARHFSSTASAEEIVEGFLPLEAAGAKIEDVRYLLGRDYETVSSYEIDLAETTLPFFRVKHLGHEYDSRTMGSGELSALALWWTIERAVEGEILLIEEPESFVSNASQNALIEHISREAMRKKLNVILTSHSPTIILRLPEGAGRFLVRSNEGVKYEPHPLPELQARIGIYPSTVLVVYVEDVVAKIVAKIWLSRCSPKLSAIADIRVAIGGVSEIEAKLSHLPNDLSNVRFIGLADGDADGKVNPALEPLIGYMPGHKAPEDFLRDAAMNSAAEISEEFGKDIFAVLSALEGKDKHDWFLNFCKIVDLSPPHVAAVLFRHWNKEPENAALSKAAFDKFQVKLKAILK